MEKSVAVMDLNFIEGTILVIWHWELKDHEVAMMIHQLM